MGPDRPTGRSGRPPNVDQDPSTRRNDRRLPAPAEPRSPRATASPARPPPGAAARLDGGRLLRIPAVAVPLRLLAGRSVHRADSPPVGTAELPDAGHRSGLPDHRAPDPRHF